MKKMKKLAGVLLAMVMVLALMVPAFASDVDGGEGGSDNEVSYATEIKIDSKIPADGSSEGETYNAYKVFDVVIGGDNQANPNAPHNYTIDSSSPFFNAVNGSDLFELTQVGETTTYNVKLVGESDAATGLAIANLLGAVANKGTPAATTKVADDKGVYTLDLEEAGPGYYLITSTLGTKLVLDTVGEDQSLEVDTKNEYPTLDKTIKSIEDGTVADGNKSGTAAYGKTVTFEIKVHVPETAAGEMTVHDKMDGDLTYVALVPQDGITEVRPTGEATSLEDGCTVEYVISADKVAALVAQEGDNGADIIIEYTATLNSDAPVNVAIKNIAHLSYSEYETPDKEVEVYTYEIVVSKVNKDGDPLAGAIFSLGMDLVDLGNNTYRVAVKGDEGTVTQFTTDETGKITIKGLAEGTYTLTEIEAPAGYNKLTAPTEIKISRSKNEKQEIEVHYLVDNVDQEAENTVEVTNLTGAELPSTGGIGTTIFYIGGGILVLAAVVVLITKRRANANDE